MNVLLKFINTRFMLQKYYYYNKKELAMQALF